MSEEQILAYCKIGEIPLLGEREKHGFWMDIQYNPLHIRVYAYISLNSPHFTPK
jgi:hypothetical protein